MTEALATTTSAVIGGIASAKGYAFISGSALGGSLVIFNDPLYIYLAVAGGISSTLGLLHEISTGDSKKSRKEIVFEALRALFLGIIITPMIFMGLMHNGGKLLTIVFGVDMTMLGGISNSFWFLMSLFLSWWTVFFVDKYTKKNKVKAVTNDDI